MEDMCLIVTPEIRQLTEKILKKYPSASQRVNLTADRVRTWVESYNKSYDKNPDFVPEVEELVADAEKKLNMDGKSFLHIVEKVVYTPTGKAQQTYTIIGNKIFNKNGEDVFSTDSTDRNKIFANLAVQNKRAVVVEYQGKKYVVNNRNQIISVTTGDIMKWGEENGDRKAILTLSKAAFEAQQKAETATTNSIIPETVYYTSKINIYAGTNENADLSNFAERPLNFGKTTAYSIPEGATSGAFKSKYSIYDIGKVTYSTKENPDYGESFVFDGLSDLFSGCRFKTVEGAFQAAKLVFTHPKGNGAKGNKYWQPKEYTQRENSVDGVYYNTATAFVLTDEGEQLLKKFQEASGTQARSLGRQIEGLDRQKWDANSSKIMKAVIGRSFEANPQALQRLLATGNATLTHTQDKGKWGTEFPKLLMEVREELRKNNPQAVNNSFQVGEQNTSSMEIKEQLINHLKSIGINVFDKAQMEKYLKENPNTFLQQALEEQQEMQDIKAKAIANGTFMKAPNGKPTNLTERQWLQVRTKAFKEWFGDWENDPKNASKVVDENGEPLIVWHGGSNVNIFDTSGKRSGGAGIKKGIKGSYFTTSKKDARRYEEIYTFKTGEQWIAYADQLREEGATEEEIAEIDKLWETQKPATRAFFLNIKTPIETIYTGNDKDGYTENTTTPENYDGQHITIEGKPYEEYVATNPNQIKSATDNNGMFSTENDDIQMFMTPEGEIYGFVTPNGDIYLDETVISPEHPIHEYTHLWDRFVAKRNPRLWKTGISIMKKTSEWQKVLNDDNYGKKWQKMDMDAATLDNLVASEVHARLTGKRGSQLLKQIAQEKGGNDIISKLKQWLFDFWKSIKGAFTPWSDTELQKLNNLAEKDIDKALQYLSDMTLKDFTEGVNPSTASLFEGVTATQADKAINDAYYVLRNIEGSIAAFEESNAKPEQKAQLPELRKQLAEQQSLIDGLKNGKSEIYINEYETPMIRKTATKQNNPIFEQFKKDIDTLVGYYEGGGRALSDDLPSITQELDDKLNDYFMIGKELSVDDYRNLWNLIEFYEDNEGIHFRERKTPSSSNTAKSANTINSGTSSNATYGMSDAMEAFYHKAVAEKFGTNNSTQTNTQNIVPEANKPKPERPKSVTYESALKLNYSRMAQFSRTFSPQQIKDRGAMIADIFSENIDLALGDEIDACLDIIESSSASEDEKTQAKQRYNLLRDPLYGRQAIVQEKGVEAIMQEIIQDIKTSMDYAEGDKKLLYQNTLDYFTELFNTQATLNIEEREGIRITSLGVAEKTASEEAADEQDDGDDEIGHIVSGSDGWSFQIRYENPFNSLSKKVRSMLYDIERPDTEKDDLGNTRKYSMGQIYASLLTYLAKNMHSADDFIQIDKSYEGTDHHGSNITEDMYPNGYPTFPVLEQMKNMYPWVNQLIDRLTDDYMSPDWNTDLRYPSTGGAMASQFYTNFRKAFIPYAKIQLGDNKFGVTPLNYEMEDRVQYDKLKANYNNRLILNDHSIYNADGKLNKKNAKWLQQQIKLLLPQLDYYSDFYKLLEEHAEHPEDELLDEKTIKEHDIFIDKCREVLNSFGIDATTDSVVAYAMIDDKLYEMLQKLEWVTENLLKVEDKDIDSFDYILDTRDKYKTNLWAHFFDGLGMITDGSYMQSFYDSASHKTKYSYSADNHLMKMFRGVCMGTLEERRQFIDEHFGKYEWFKNQDTGEWRNKWLEYWYNEPNEQRELPYKNIDNITEYKEDETIIRPYVKWTEDDIWQVQNRSYLPDSKSKFSFFLAPIFSDSPMSMTVKGPKLDMTQLLYGYNDNTGHHQGALVSLVNQELWRIGFTQRRAEEIKKGNIKYISNFDEDRGQQFCFLPELNKYTFKDTGETFLERMVSLRDRRATLDEIESSQIEAIEDIIDKKAIEYMEENDKHYESESIKKDAYYNMVYANAAIIQMTTVDLAFYSKDVDFQKRFKEVYAGGIELNTNSKYGKKTENVILLTDDTITSPSYDKIAAIIDNSESLSQSDKDYIKSTFTEINVADAQAIRSMHSYRSVLDMMGRWDDRMEKAIQNFENKEWKREDFDIIFQTIKPFVYAVIDRNDGFGGKIPVPQQNKNSEICALMMYDLIVNDLKDSPVYRALSRFMEETADANGEPLIDMAQFESAGKVGNQGVINISFNPNKVVDIINQGIVINGKEFTFYPASKDGKFLNNTVENAEKNYKEIKKDIDKDLIEGRMSQKEHNEIIAYLRPTEDEIIDMLSQAALITNSDGSKSINPEVVHTIPFSNYYQQQPTPEHHIDAEATYGSQARNIAVADLPENLEITLEGKGKNKKTFKGRDAIIDFYYELLNENLIEDFFGKGKKQGLKGIFATKESLRDAITDIVRGNPKYGRDFVDALQIDNNENFVLNPNSPTMFNLTQELITSFFKNRITKQTINGAALIQAAGIGLDDKLRIVFDDNGKVLGAQCLMPLTAKAFFEPLLEEETINGKKVKVLKPEKLEELGLDKAIGYRIPTENKSSMMPLIITGFTPLQNGSCIVLPAEITNIAGSDFDVDKMFIMLLSFNIITHDKKKALEDYAKQEHEDAQKMINLLGKANIEDLEIDEIGGNFAEWFKKHEDEYLLKTPIIKKVEYDFGKDFSKSPKDNSRKARNNMLIQLTYKILTSKEGSESLFNPQGFADVKRAAKITRILTDTNLRKALLKNNEALGILPPVNIIVSEFLSIVQKKYPEQYDDIKQAVSKMTTKQIQQAYLQAITAGQHGDAIQMLLNSSTKDLEKFIEKNSAPESPIFPQTFTHSHARNMAGANQIGIYAIQASMAAKYQRASVKLLEKQQFTVNGRKITNVDVSDNGKRLKNLGQMIGASADNGKDPNLSDMGSTDKTAPIIGYMLRSGLTHLEAALIINQNHMRNSNYSSKKYKYWDSILGKNHLSVPVENVTTDMLIKNLISPFELTAEEDKQIAALCYRILTQHEAQEYLTQISRADSPNGSIQNTYAKARIQQYKVDLFQAKMGQKDFPFLRIKEAISNKAIDTAASEGVVREQLKNQRMGFLHGMYALGINSFSNLVAPYFFGARKKFDDVVVKPILYNLNERLSDTKKEEIINNIYTSYITFILSGTPLFGTNSTDSMKQKRDYYLESFPDDYIKIIQENEDIRKLLSSILQVNSFGSRKRIILQDVGSLSKEQKQSVQFRFESLADSENPVARQLATDLFVYSYFDNGLQFTHDSFSHLFSTRFLINFPVYNEALQKLDEDLDESEYKNFIQQFLVTFNNAAFKVDDIITKDNLDESTDTIKINLNDKKMYNKMVNELMSPKPQFEINVYPYISYNNEIYVLDEDLFSQYPGNPTYHKLPKYATYPRLPLFSREMNITELAAEFPISESTKPSNTNNSSSDAPMAYNESDEDSSIDNSTDAAFEAMDDFVPDYDPNDVENIPISKSDTYLNEGNDELQKPMCG